MERYVCSSYQSITIHRSVSLSLGFNLRKRKTTVKWNNMHARHISQVPHHERTLTIPNTFKHVMVNSSFFSFRFLTLYVFGSCFRTLAVILVSDYFCCCLFFKNNNNNKTHQVLIIIVDFELNNSDLEKIITESYLNNNYIITTFILTIYGVIMTAPTTSFGVFLL